MKIERPSKVYALIAGVVLVGVVPVCTLVTLVPYWLYYGAPVLDVIGAVVGYELIVFVVASLWHRLIEPKPPEAM